MGMDPSNPHHQVMVTNSSSLEDVINCSSKPQQQQQQSQKIKASSSVLVRPTQPDLKCPRCDSSNTKFCYYNNYSLSQPRYFCKGCRRYWTQGGSLRNVPVGGGCRKSNKRPSPSSSSASSSCITSSKKTLTQDHQIFTINSNSSSLPPLTYDSNDLTLAFSRVLHKQQQQQPTSTSTTMQLGFDYHHDQVSVGNPTTTQTKTTHCDTLGSPNTSTENNNNNNNNGSTGFLDALRNGFLENQSGFQNFQYGFGNCNVGDNQLDNQNGAGVGGVDHLPYQEITSTTTTTTRTEDYFGDYKGGRDGAAADQSKVFVNFPWHQFSNTTGDGGNINVDSVSASASGRDQLYWNNGFGSSWHGLVNSL